MNVNEFTLIQVVFNFELCEHTSNFLYLVFDVVYNFHLINCKFDVIETTLLHQSCKVRF